MEKMLIPINYEGEQPTVSARDLHEALEIKSKYADWFKTCQHMDLLKIWTISRFLKI